MIREENSVDGSLPTRLALRRLASGLVCVLAVAGCIAYGRWNSSPSAAMYRVRGVSTAEISLNGTWQFLLNPPEHFWESKNSILAWQAIAVPGEPQMQGFDVRNDREFAYLRRFRIPTDFAGQRVFVRFEGVYGEARVWVNGHFLCKHLGSFTIWECELTDWVKPGEEAVLTVGDTDRTDDISEATGYAKHCIGGILRSVSLLARPQTYVRNLRVETPLTEDNRAAILRVTATMEFKGNREATLHFSLSDARGREITLSAASMTLSATSPYRMLEIPVASPQLWDAEHPRLYTLTTRCVVDGKEVSTQQQTVGFREVKVLGEKLLINGRIVKLRGVCRHDMHPLLGRVSMPAYELEDVLLAKEANINFIRTSHYPPTENFLRNCDEQGIYVEAESAVCFNQTGADQPYKSKLEAVTHDPAYTAWYLGQIREMVESFRGHPSVIIWSAGNESRYGMNIGKSLDLIRELDETRPTIFAYSKTAIADGAQDRFDLCSIHYPTVSGTAEKDSNQFAMANWSTDGRPTIGDEWAHVPCYCTDTLKIDPGIQDFWGESLSRMWTSCYNSEAGIGGAIWGFVDETFQLPERCVGYGPWGIVDTWRRKKPEFWNTKKAYSPVHLLAAKLNIAGSEATLPIQNRYNHTNLDELTVRWNYEGQSASFTPAALPPRAQGMLTLPALAWRDGTFLQLDFIEPGGRVVDTYRIAVGAPRPNAAELAESPVHLEQSATDAVVRGEDFSVTFDKSTGLIREVQRLGQRILTDSPRLNVSTTDGVNSWSGSDVIILESLNEPFVLEWFKVNELTNSVRVVSKGKVGARSVTYTMTVHGNGRMTIDFELFQTKALFCQEVGLAFVLETGFSDIAWERESDLWTSYPDDHIGRLNGRMPCLAPELATAYRQPPVGSWALDSRDYFLYGSNQVGTTLTRDAKSCRPFIRTYTVSGRNRQIVVRGTGREGARIRQLDSGKIALIVNTDWDYLNLGWGNYERGLKLPLEYRGQVELDLRR
jgi:beta-galactosidase/beta-glucuronidase